MDLKKNHSKSKIATIFGLIFVFVIVLIFSDFSLTFFGNSESEHKKSESVPQSKSKNDLFLEKESTKDKKNDSVLPNKELNTENSEEKDILKKNIINTEKLKRNDINNKKISSPSNFEKEKKDASKAFEDPVMTVNFLHEGIKKINANINSDLKNVLNLIDQTYDAEKMLKMIIGTDWKKIESKKKKELIKVFKIYISKNYLKRFSKIKEIKFKNEGKEKISSELFLIKSNLFINQEKISIDYLLSFKNNTWKIFDVLLDGSVSEIATKKSEFYIFIKEKEIDSLIDALKKFNNKVLS